MDSIMQEFRKSIDDCEFTFREKLSQSVYIWEEIAEIVKEFSKIERNTDNTDHIIDEEITLIMAMFIDLRRRGVSFEKIFNSFNAKAKHAMDWFYASGEL